MESQVPRLYSLGEIARLLSVPAHRIDYAHATGRLGEPCLRFVGKRAYDDGDLRRVAAYFGVEVGGGGARHQDEKETSCDTSTRT
jgi:hypothetical protein